MASSYDPIRGLSIKHGFYKSVHKGEDTWAQKPGVKVPTALLGKGGEVSLDVFGVFDGHGGKQAATFAARSLVDKLLDMLPSVSLEAAAKSPPPAELEECAEVSAVDWQHWEAQDDAVVRLPEALCKAFQNVQSGFFEATKESGTTATAAVLIGWELLVANVGDSCAFLDTGTEVLQVSANHRLDDNRAEQERIKALGCEISSSTVEGKPCGPLRVWPGGLAMSRTIGDFEAGEVVLCEPEVRQVTLPSTGGRIIIASDGLWDAVAAKTAVHHVRGIPASKAARELVGAALKAKGLKDDITVLVIDAMPSAVHKLPPLLAKDGSGNLQALGSSAPAVNVYNPLEDGEVGVAAWQRLQWQRRLEAVRSAFPDAFREPEEVQILEPESSGHSSNTVMADPDLAAENEDDSASDDGSVSPETSSACLSSNPYALMGDDQLGEDGDSWETVPVRSKAVPPKRGRVHAMQGQGSPSEPWQLPKALREAPPSPAASPMQTSEIGSLSSEASTLRARFSQRGRGGGRRGQGRRRHGGAHPPGLHEKVPRHIHGFQVNESQQPMPSDQEAAFNSGVTFLSEGGFSLHPPPQAGVEEPPPRQHSVVKFTMAPKVRDSARHGRLQGGRQRRQQRPPCDGSGREGGSAERSFDQQQRGRGRYRPRKPAPPEVMEQPVESGRRGRGGRGRRSGRGRNSARRGECLPPALSEE